MKRLILIFVLCGLFLPTAYGKTISHTFASGNKYVGEVKNGKQHGQGTFTWADGRKFVGEWKDGNRHGQGSFTWANENQYVGEFKDGKLHGQGTFTWPGGNKYVGQWKDGIKHGQGTKTWVNGSKYVGAWKGNKHHGQGTFTYLNGDEYVGEYQNGKMQGKGTIVWAVGEKYVGEWKDGKIHGLGTWVHPDKDRYVGEYKNGKMHGQGTYTDNDGQKYIGEYKNGEMHGQGTVVWADGKRSVGEYRHDHFWQGMKYDVSGEVIRKQLDGMFEPACNGKQLGGWGAGFAVNQHHVVTNSHVIACCQKVVIHNLVSCAESVEGSVVATEQKSDLGLLRLDKSLRHYGTLTPRKGLQVGEVVSTYDRRRAVLGCPQFVVGQGRVTKLNWMPNDARVMMHDGRTSFGSSGGPVLDDSGHIVGVSIVGSVNSDTDRSWSNAVNLHLLEAFLESNHVEYNTSLSTEKLSLSEIKKKSDKFTVVIHCLN